MISILLSLSISIHVSSTSDYYNITDTPVLLEFPQSLDDYIYVVFLNADHFVLSNGSLLNRVYKDPENFYVQTKVYPSFKMYIEIFQITDECDSIDFVLNYDPNPIEITSDLVEVSKSYCIFFASASFMDYTFYQDSLKNANVELYHYLTYIPHIPFLSDSRPEVTIKFSKNTILRLQTSDQGMTGSWGLKSMEYSDSTVKTPPYSYLENGTYYYPGTANILPGSVNSNSEYYADFNLVHNKNMKLQSGSYVLTFASGQSYNGSKRQFVIFQTHKDQKISDVTATAKSGKNSEILLGNTSIYGVFYRSDGQLILNSTKIYSSLYLTVYSNETTDFGCDTQVVLLGNATAVLVTKNYPGAAPGYGVFISKKHEGYCFYSAFVPVEIVASTYLEGSFSISQYDINGNYISSRDSILNLYQYRYPFVTHILGVRDNEGPSLLGFYVSTEEYNFKTAILVDNEKADARFVSISDTNCTLEIIIAVAAGVVIIIIIVSIVFCCYCCCCKKKKKDNAESKSSSSDSSHNI